MAKRGPKSKVDSAVLLQMLHEDAEYGRFKRIADRLGVSARTIAYQAERLEQDFPTTLPMTKEQISARAEKTCETKKGISLKIARREKDFRLHLLRHARTRAEIKGIDFDLELSDIVVPELCPVLGIKLVVNRGSGCHDSSMSLDRIDNSRGYVWDNVLVISGRANRLKNDSTQEERVKLANFYVDYQPVLTRQPVVIGRKRTDKKLTEEQEVEIKRLYTIGNSAIAIASWFSISSCTVWLIIRGRPSRIYGKGYSRAKKSV